MIGFTPMTPQQYDSWLPRAIAEYAKDKVQARQWPALAATERATEAYRELLPHGLQTPEHHLLTVTDMVSGEPVGMIWFHCQTSADWTEAYIYNLEIEAPYQGRGLGKAAMAAVEGLMRDMGIQRIGLHVFGFNHRARHLYERSGYLTTGINMAKDL
jgi:RimJ/RimL family protein N-acetyltransferase